MQLKKSSFGIFFFILSAACSAQKVNTSDSTFKIIDGNKIHNAIYGSINEHYDLLKWAGSGTLFFRMKLSNGYFTDIKCSAKEPSVLINLVTDALRTQEIKIENFDSAYSNFILPVIFNFGSFNSMDSVQHLLKAIPDINVKELVNTHPADPFKLLFDIGDNSSSVYATKCIFLPWITLRGRLR